MLIKDRKISPAVRFNAIKLSLALAGHVEPKAPETEEVDGKRVAEMTLAELDAFLAEEKAKRARSRRVTLLRRPRESPRLAKAIRPPASPLADRVSWSMVAAPKRQNF